MIESIDELYLSLRSLVIMSINFDNVFRNHNRNPLKSLDLFALKKASKVREKCKNFICDITV